MRARRHKLRRDALPRLEQPALMPPPSRDEAQDQCHVPRPNAALFVGVDGANGHFRDPVATCRQ